MFSRGILQHGRLLRVSYRRFQASNLQNHLLFKNNNTPYPNFKGDVRWLTGSALRSSQKKPSAPEGAWRTRLRRFARFAKYVRIPTLIISVYALGRQEGIIECTRNPRLVEDELLQTILADVGVTNREQVKIYTSEDRPAIVSSKDPQKARLQAKTIRVGNDIVRVASLYVREEMRKAIKKVQEKVPSDISREEFMKICHKDEDFSFWSKALYRVEGEDPTIPWKYVIVDTPIDNAFVSEILPQRIFITTGMFEHHIQNEDELAVILGHEMSHLILGHVSQRIMMETALRTIEVLLLSMDPTEGIVSLAVISGLAWMRRVLLASFSRENESEADELGVKLAAWACYDTKKGVYVMKKMHDHQVVLGGGKNPERLSLMDTHPPSLGRYRKLEELAEEENPGKYPMSCGAVYQRMAQAIWK